MSPKNTGEFYEVKQIIFDVGGVLFQFTGGLNKLSIITGLPYQKVHQIWQKFDESICRGEIAPQELLTAINRERDCHIKQNFDFITFWINCFQPNLQVHQLIKDLSQKYKIGILTNIYPDVYQKAIKTKNIPNIAYNFIIKSCEVGLIKPEIEIYKLAQQKSGQKSKDILFIDDKIEFLKPAQKLGWKTFLFNANKPDKSALQLRNNFAI